jgi:adenine-specific DNA-methyltransferase
MDDRLKDIDLWRSELGLFPVPLFSDDSQDKQFVLLNGSRGNFCLDLTNQHLSLETRNRAWSSNVGHYVGLVDHHIEVQRWDQRKQSIERYSYESVSRDLEKFHSHLEKDEPRWELSVVSHVIRVFRSLRSALGRSSDGYTSLKAFLYLLACVTDRADRGKVTLESWQLDESAAGIAENIRAADWNALVDDLMIGRPLEGLIPNLTLLLRHASGQVFQEAHYEAVSFPQEQFMLNGFAPTPIRLGDAPKGVGLHFTPPALARTLIEECFEQLSILPTSLVVFDPSCGSGEFLREALRQLKIRQYKGTIKLIGWDVSQAACDMAAFLLSWESRGHNTEIVTDLRCVDSIVANTWPKDVDIVVMNPPFVSWEDMSEQQKEALSQVLGNLTKLRPDLSSAFLLKAAFSVRRGGVLSSILPASFLDGDSAAGVRERLGEILTPRLLARLGSHQLFRNALVDAGFYVASANGNKPESVVAFWADHRPQSSSAGLRMLRKIRNSPTQNVFPIAEKGFSIYLNPEIGRGRESWAPRPYDAWKLFNSLRGFPQVGDIFDVKQGVRTGLNKTFILSKEQWEKLSTKRARSYFHPAVLNESIQDGVITDSAYVFYPYGKNSIDSESELQEMLGSYYLDFLLPNKEELSRRGSKRKANWWELSEHRAWQETSEPKIVSTYFGNSGSFGWDSGGKYVVVQGFGWLYKPTKDFPKLTAEIGLSYLAILNSRLFSKLLSATSNHVGGGQWNLSKKFVKKVPLPSLFNSQISAVAISELSSIGRSIHAGLPVAEETREDLVNAIYGLDDAL